MYTDKHSEREGLTRIVVHTHSDVPLLCEKKAFRFSRSRSAQIYGRTRGGCGGGAVLCPSERERQTLSRARLWSLFKRARCIAGTYVYTCLCALCIRVQKEERASLSFLFIIFLVIFNTYVYIYREREKFTIALLS